MSATRKQYRAVVVEIDTNATIEAWQYTLPYAQRSGFAQWIMQAYAEIRTSQPQATIILRYRTRLLAWLHAAYGLLLRLRRRVIVRGLVQRRHPESAGEHGNSLLVELEFSALYYLQGDYGVPADTQTACLHPNKSGAQKIAQYGLLPALDALL